MNLEWLRTFVAVYRAGSLSAARRELGLTQPAVSQHLKSLEGFLGRALFVRQARGVEPTAAGHALYRASSGPLDALLGACAAAQAGQGQLAGTVFFGAPADLFAARVAGALTPLCDQQIRFRVRLGVADELLDELREGQLDLVISTIRRADARLEFEPLFIERFVLVSAPSLHRTHASRSAEALSSARWIAFAENLPIVRRYMQVALGRRTAMQATIVVPDLRSVLAAVVAGAGISVLPHYLCEAALRSGELVELHRPETPPMNTLFLARAKAKGAPRDARIAAVREVLLRAARAW